MLPDIVRCCGTWTVIRGRNRFQTVHTAAVMILVTCEQINPKSIKIYGGQFQCVISKPLFYFDTSLINRQILFKIFTPVKCILFYGVY